MSGVAGGALWTGLGAEAVGSGALALGRGGLSEVTPASGCPPTSEPSSEAWEPAMGYREERWL